MKTCSIDFCQGKVVDDDRLCKSHARQSYLYNLNECELNALVRETQSGCKICRKIGVKLFVDHDHSCCAGNKSCGKCVRGFVCLQCNTALSRFDDNAFIIKKAIKYLKKSHFDTRKIPDECHDWKDSFWDNKWSLYRLGRNRLNFLMDIQRDSCAICEDRLQGRNFSVDHDHNCCDGYQTCGSCIRGLLCQKCNLGIGYVKDNAEILENMVQYLLNRDGSALEITY